MKYYKYETNKVASGWLCAESFEKARAILTLTMIHDDQLLSLYEVDPDTLTSDERIAYYTITKNKLMNMINAQYNF